MEKKPRPSQRRRKGTAMLEGRQLVRDMSSPATARSLLEGIGVPLLRRQGRTLDREGRVIPGAARREGPGTLHDSELTRGEREGLGTSTIGASEKPGRAGPSAPREAADASAAKGATGTPGAALLFAQLAENGLDASRLKDGGGSLIRAVGGGTIKGERSVRVQPAGSAAAPGKISVSVNTGGSSIGSGFSGGSGLDDGFVDVGLPEIPTTTIDIPTSTTVTIPDSTPHVPSTTCYRFRGWSREPATERLDACPVENEEDWEYADFTTCVGLGYSEAESILTAELGTGWRSSLWALVGLDAEDDDTLASNLAPESIEPRWYEWSAGETNYAPSTTDTPRKTFMLRVLGLITTFQEGVPKTQQDTDIWPWIIDPIAAGAMSYRIYERKVSEEYEDLIQEFLDLVDALAAIQGDMEALRDDVVSTVTGIPGWIATILSTLIPTLGDVIDLIDDLLDCLRTGDCDDLVEDVIGGIEEKLGIIWDFITWLAEAGLDLAEDLLALVEDIGAAVIELGELVLELGEFILEFDLEELIMNVLVALTNCTGPEGLEFVSGPPTVSPATDPDCLADCGPLVTGEVNIEGSIDFQFQYTGTAFAESIRANHSIAPSANLEIELSEAGVEIDLSYFPWGNRVWFCITKLDCSSMMYDWLVALATVHYAESFQTGHTDEQRRRLLLGANYLLRRALAVAVDYGETVAHETMHNRSLFHCDEIDIMGGRNIGCQQDAVAVPWRLYVMARLGLPWVSVTGDFSGTVNVPFTNTISWDIDLQIPQGDCNGVVTAASSGTTPFQPYNWVGAIECEEANYVFTSASAAATAEDIGNALQIAGFLLGSATLVVIGTTLEALAELPVSGFVSGDVNFNIDRPLEMGGQVTWCCILNRPEECAGDTEPVACWPLDDPPCGMDFHGCCCADSYLGST